MPTSPPYVKNFDPWKDDPPSEDTPILATYLDNYESGIFGAYYNTLHLAETAGDEAAVFRGFTSQSADIVQVQAVSTVILAGYDKNGIAYFQGTSSTTAANPAAKASRHLMGITPSYNDARGITHLFGEETVRVTAYGDTVWGQQYPDSSNYDGTQDWMDAGYLAKQRKFYTRSLILTEMGDSVDLNIRRAGNGGGPDPSPPRGSKQGIVSGVIRWIPSGFAWTAGVPASTDPMQAFPTVSQAGASIASRTEEDVMQVAVGSSWYTTGSSLNFFTTPTGLTLADSLLADPPWLTERLTIRPLGAIGALGPKVAGSDLDGPYDRGDIVAEANIVAGYLKTTFTVNVSTPSSATFTTTGDHDLRVGDEVWLITTGALPTGLTNGKKYYVVSTPTTKTFTLSTTAGGSAVVTSGTQSGTHSYFSGLLNWPSANTKTTIGANGAATALTANPVGYALVAVAGQMYQMPYYNI